MVHATFERVGLAELFGKPGLVIPGYQRPYSWGASHVQALLRDLEAGTKPYLMGTVILHGQGAGGQRLLEVVDGQQRLVTLSIMSKMLGMDVEGLPLLKATFSPASHGAIANCCELIRGFLAGKDDDDKTSLRQWLADPGRGGVLFDVLTLDGENALDQAYVFFDSVNSKGKALTDFDLLKAHHLMFIPAAQESLAARHNDDWQSRDDRHLHLFTTLLRRLRMWARGEDRDRRQERPDYNEFCSIVEPESGSGDGGERIFNRYMQPAAFRSWRRIGDHIVLSMDYPVPNGEDLLPAAITQSIEGGDPFFLYAKRYHRLYEALFSGDTYELSSGVAFVRRIRSSMGNYYLQNAFEAILLLYFDKFGEDRLAETGVCLERILSQFRYEKPCVRIEGVLSHVNAHRLVPMMLEAVSPRQVGSPLLTMALAMKPPPLESKGVRYGYFRRMEEFYNGDPSRLPRLAGGVLAMIGKTYPKRNCPDRH